MYIVSRCLLGYDCKYDGGNNKNDAVIEFCKAHDYVTICPETAGGLDSPRAPAEIVKRQSEAGEGIQVVNSDGADVTRQFKAGAEISVRTVEDELSSRGDTALIEGAILKSGSPSCGSGYIYDGTFTHTKTKGNGIFTDMLQRAHEMERDESPEGLAGCSFAKDFKIVDENSVSKLINK